MESPSRQMWFWFGQHIRRPVVLFWLGLVTAVAPTLILPLIGILVRYAFDEAIPNDDMDRLGLAAGGVLLLFLLNSVLTLITRNRTLCMTKEAVTRLRADLLHTLYSASWPRFSKHPTGQMHSVLVQDTQRVDALSNAIVWEIIPGVLVTGTLWLYLLILEWRLGLLFTGMLVTMGLVTIGFRKPLKRRAGEHHQASHGVSGGLLSALRAMLLTRAEAVESVEMDRQKKRFDWLREAGIRNNWMESAYRIAQETTIVAFTLIILVTGGVFVNAGWMSLGEFLAAFVVVGLTRGYAQKLVSGIPTLIEGAGALQRLYQLGSMGDSCPYLGTGPVNLQDGVILKRVAFGYGDCNLLDEIDLSLVPGSMVAVIGANGTGKTTLAHLVLGFLAPSRGRLLVQGRPYADLDMGSLRKQISFLPQDPILFAGTLLENVRYGCPSATRDEVLQALDRVNADAFMVGLPQGIDTVLEQGGVQVSGGERQKIALARAFLKPSRVLVLDEPSNHLDTVSVLAVIQELRNLPVQPAILVLSHDESIIEAADRVYRIQGGRLVELSMPATSEKTYEEWPGICAPNQ